MVRRVPIVVVAVMTAMVVTAVSLKCRTRYAGSAGVAATVAPRETVPRVATSATGLGAGPPPPSASAAPDPPMAHGDPRRTHRAAARAPRSLPTVVWSRDLGGPVEAQVTASPDGKTLYAASLAGTVTALDRTDGTVRWTLGLGDRVYAAPAVGADGTLFVGSDAKKFVAISPDGKIKWSLDTDGDADTGAAIATDGSLVFAAGRMVYDVNPAGSVKWRFAAKRKVFTAPALGADGHVYFGSQDHHAYALADNGHLAWSVDLGADVDGGPAVGDEGEVFFGTDGGEIARLDPTDGRVAWRTALEGYVRGPLAAARNGDVLAGVYGPKPRATRLRAADGGVRGSFSIQGTGARDFGVHGGALEDEDGTLVFGTQDDAVYAVDAMGRTLWRFVTGGDVDAPVTLLSDGWLVVGSDDGSVRALRGEAPPRP